MTKDRLLLLATVCGISLGGCAQIPWLQGDDPTVQNNVRDPDKPGVAPFTTATVSPGVSLETPKTTVPVFPPLITTTPVAANTNVAPGQTPSSPNSLVASPVAVPGSSSRPAEKPQYTSFTNPTAPIQIAQATPGGLAQPPGPPPGYQLQPTGPARNPAVVAFELLCQGRQSDFVDELKKISDPATRVVLEKLLPEIKRLTDGNPRKLSPAEIASFELKFKEVRDMLPKTELVIDNVCFCEWVKSFGNYEPLKDGHIFQGSTATKPGERIQLYVEVRNFECTKTEGYYETRLSSTVEISDNSKGGKQVVWSHNFDDKGHCVRTRSPLHDYFNNYCFYLPNLPQGNYTLTIRIVDQTRADAPREATKKIILRVGAGQR